METTIRRAMDDMLGTWSPWLSEISWGKQLVREAWRPWFPCYPWYPEIGSFKAHRPRVIADDSTHHQRKTWPNRKVSQSWQAQAKFMKRAVFLALANVGEWFSWYFGRLTQTAIIDGTGILVVFWFYPSMFGQSSWLIDPTGLQGRSCIHRFWECPPNKTPVAPIQDHVGGHGRRLPLVEGFSTQAIYA